MLSVLISLFYILALVQSVSRSETAPPAGRGWTRVRTVCVCVCTVGTQVQVLVLVQVLTRPLVFLPAGSDSAGFGRSYWTLLHFLSHDSWWGFYFLFPELVFQNESVARCTAASFQQRPWW